MTPYHKRVTAFTQRMAQDMQLRILSPRTIEAYTYHVDRFALRFGKHPEELGPEQVREFQLWMIHDLIGDLQDQEWVVFVEGPPRPDCQPQRMLKYLTRYLTGGPISDQRIVGERDGHIHFMARSKRKIEGKRPQVEETLPVVEFIRRWTLHILPPEFTKARWYGSWSPRHRIEYTERCQRLYTAGFSSADSGCAALSTTEGDQPCTTSPRKDESRAAKERPCPHCAKPMACMVDERRPSWREVFYGPYHPEWFEWITTGNFPPDEPPDKVDGEFLHLADAASALADKCDLFEELDTWLEQALE